uniref:BURP domain-containing protein n=1 Tax=Picea sitchensis TaxID=3332 RepID=A9NU27_PICSI|nr:unknown [Picea sitchensis]
MRFSTALVVLLHVVVGSEAMHAKSSTSPTLSYWHLNLPTTPIPDTLRELISPLSSEKTSELLDAIREGKKVSMAEPDPTPKLGRKGGPDSVASQVPQGIYIYGSAADDDIIADPSVSAMFFHEKDLHTGRKLTLYSTLLKRSSPDNRVFFLPRRLAEAIPFSSDKLSVALEKLDISQGSDTALAMKQTLKACEGPANSGERRYCATSLESMIDYTTSTLGTSSLNVLETNVPCKLESQKYTITGIPFQSKSGSKAVVCHSETYAYAVYYCHEAQHITTARVSLKGEDGSSGEGVAVCHTDTSGWNPQHLAFKVLNVKPGGAPVCHFVPNGEVLWLPAH